MSGAQKGIKYVAICFAIVLIVAIISGIVSAGLSLFKMSGFITNYKTSSLDSSKYTSLLDVNLKYTDLKIVKGEVLKVDNKNEKVKVKQEDNKIIITDKSSIFSKRENDELIIYVPENLIFDIVNVSTGAGKIIIDGITAKNINFEFGAGKATLSNLKANNADIETGAGKIDILNSELNNLDMELGIGEANIVSKITGKSEIECGIGKATINIENSEKDFTLEFDKGIGSITYNGIEVSDNYKIGNGINYLKIDGGIGKIVINTKEIGGEL